MTFETGTFETGRETGGETGTDTANVQQIRRHLARGNSVRLVQDFYGRPHAEVRSRWLFWRTKRLPLDRQEAAAVTALIAAARKPRS